MLRPRTTAAAAATALLLPLTAAGHAAAAPGDADPPAPRSVAPFCAPVPQAFEPFTDVEGGVHQAAISCAAYAEIARGGPGYRPRYQYAPDRPVRRDQMASFIARMMDTAEEIDTGDGIRALPAYDGSSAFTDVPTSSPHVEAVDRLRQAGIVEGGPAGQPDDQFGPLSQTRRDQMASFVNRAVRYMTGSPFTTDADYFVDDEDSVHEDNVNGVASAAVAVGNGGDSYVPDQAVPRDQMASFLLRTLAALREDGLVGDVSAVTAAVVQYDQRGFEVRRGSTITGTVWGADDATSVAVSGECVVDGTVADTDGSREGLRFSVPLRPEAAGGSCGVTFTTAFPDGTRETDVVYVAVV